MNSGKKKALEILRIETSVKQSFANETEWSLCISGMMKKLAREW